MPIRRFAVLVSCCTALQAAPATHSMTVENRTRDVLRGVYLSPSTSDHWGPERADDNVRIGGRLAVALPGAGCRWDVRVLLGGRPAEQIFHNRDLCRRPVVVVDGRNRFLRGSEPPRWN